MNSKNKILEMFYKIHSEDRTSLFYHSTNILSTTFKKSWETCTVKRYSNKSSIINFVRENFKISNFSYFK